MSLDTKYRPRNYQDVVGQEASVEVLRRFVDKGKGFQQSYLFAGAKGCGKTTLGRILARALLCDSPNDGNPCDECDSCLNMLSDPPSHECFTEMDAATNSGKDEIQKIVETQEYETFSGRHRVYLIDECFTEDTMLVTPLRPRSIRDLVLDKYDGDVLSFDVEKKTVCWKPVTDWFEIEEEREVVTLDFDNGVTLTVTTDQDIYTRNRGWIKAMDLTSKDDICETSLDFPRGDNHGDL